MRRYTCAFIFLQCYFLSAFALDEQKLDTTIVSAQSLDLDTSTTIVLNEQAYAYESLESALKKNSGIQTQTTGANGSYSSIWIRGASSKASGIYLDGIKINDPLNGGINLSTLPLWALESVEIYKTKLPSDIGFGESNNGLSLNTRSSRRSETVHDLKLSYGSFNQQTLSINSSINDILLSAEYYSADNDFSYQHDNNTKFNPHDDFQTKRSNNQVERKFVMLKGQQTFSHIESTGLVLLRDYTTGINNNLNQAKSAYIEQSSVIAALSLEPSQTSTQIWQAQLNLNQANHLYDDLGNEIGLASDKQEIEYSELTTNLTFKKPLSFLNSSSQINFSYLSLNGEEISQSLIKNLDIDKKHYSISQSFSNTNFQLSLSAGGLDSANKTQDYWSLGTHIFFDINSIDFLASAARKVRLPTTSELYLNQGNQSGNSDLTPEIFHEVSLKTQLNQSRYGIEMEGFYRQSQDSIVFSYNAQGVGRADNQGGSILYGVDIQAYAQLGSVQLDFSSSIMNSENQIRNNAYSGKYLPNIFHVTSFVRLQYPFNRWITGIEHHTQSGLYYDSANSQKAKDQSYLNATLEYAFKKGLIALKINNILDKQYTGFKTEPLPGRSGLLSIQYQL